MEQQNDIIGDGGICLAPYPHRFGVIFLLNNMGILSWSVWT